MKKIALLLMSICGISMAGEKTAVNVSIKKIHPMSTHRVEKPSSAGYTRIYLTQDVFSSSTCSKDRADLSNDDNHILSTLLTAWTTGMKIDIRIEESKTPIDDTCQLTAINVYD